MVIDVVMAKLSQGGGEKACCSEAISMGVRGDLVVS